MTKAELIERVVESFWDFSAEEPEEYVGMDPINLKEAEVYLSEARATERDCELEPDECMPADVTPEIYMEAWNCYIRMMQHRAVVNRLAEWLTEAEDVCDYDNFRTEYLENSLEVIPTDFLTDSRFPFSTGTNDDLTVIDILDIGARSRHTFNANHEYCWYDREKMQMFSSNHPFADGVIDAVAMATYAVEGSRDLLTDIVERMDDDEIQRVFGKTKEEVLA